MMTERFLSVFMAEGEDITLRPGQRVELPFSMPEDVNARLFLAGETALHYLWKDEPDYPVLYRQIEDALDRENAWKAPYCLRFAPDGTGERYAQRAFKKVQWPPVLSYLRLTPLGESFSFGLSVRAEGLALEGDGYARMRVEVRRARPGVSHQAAMTPPDEAYTLDIEPGTYGWRTLARDIAIPKEETANVCVFLEAEGYRGTLYVERPFLTAADTGYNVLPDFGTDAQDKQWFAWTGQSLSTKEWPELEFSINGTPFFSGPCFERCHRYSETERDVPDGLIMPGKNTLGIRLLSQGGGAMPYNIHQVGFSLSGKAPIEILACPDVATEGEGAYVLFRTEPRGRAVEFHCPTGALSPEAEMDFPLLGMRLLRLKTRKAANDIAFSLAGEGCRAEGCLRRVARRPADGVITGTGDMIYVPQTPSDTADYLRWYLREQIGGLLTLRPTYRWCGTRTVHEALWWEVTPLLAAAGVRYAHMLDGRELPGLNANPPLSLLDGEAFLGRQEHERDGAQFYWAGRVYDRSPATEQFHDLAAAIFRGSPDSSSPSHAAVNFIEQPRTLTMYKDPQTPPDMAACAEFSVSQLAKTRHDATRHTGPSVMFKYFFQAGYRWLGAETMYGSMEPLLAFLRGAGRCYGTEDIGVHHAVQWSSSPHDTKDRFRRYWLALFVSYVQGVTQVNTEEGLWHMEEYYSYFNRFGDACLGHTRQQQSFNRYVKTHSRTGKFYTPFAFLHGRYDGWHAFGHRQVWGRPDFPECAAEQSWDLLKTFYPLSRPGDTLYIHNCPTEAVGYYSGTPRGNADVVPVEGDGALLSNYRALAFLGYNAATAEDFDRLQAYVEAGGSLLLGWPHLSRTTLRADVESYRHAYLAHPLAPGTTGEFVRDTAGGLPVMVQPGALDGEVLEKTDQGRPLVLRRRLGKGQVYFVNAREYPAEDGVRPVYEGLIARVSDALNEKEDVFLRCGDDVQFALYPQEDGQTHLYLLAVDWFREPERVRRATLLLSGREYPQTLSFFELRKIVARGGRAAWSHTAEADVLSLTEDTLQVQGYGKAAFSLAADGRETVFSVDFAEAPVQTFRLDALPKEA